MEPGRTMSRPGKIVLISLDTLRADHLGCYGYRRPTSPAIDGLSRESVVFEHAFSTCSDTNPSHASILTGRYPGTRACGSPDGTARPDRAGPESMLQEILLEAGFDTAAFVSSLLLGREAGLSRGFRTYDDDLPPGSVKGPDRIARGGLKTNARAFAWLEENCNKDFFLFLHYFDVHGPYRNPQCFEEVFVGDEYYGDELLLEAVPARMPCRGIPEEHALRPERDSEGRLVSYERDARYYVAEYDAGVRYADHVVGALISRLRSLGIYDDCLLIVTSDHGEAMGENEVWFCHGLTVTPDQIHVPLIVKPHAGWGVKPHRAGLHVTLADISPTVCALVGAGCDRIGLDGISLRTLIETRSDVGLGDRTIVSERDGQTAFIGPDSIRVQPAPFSESRLMLPWIAELCGKTYVYRTRPLSLKALKREMVGGLELTGERYLPWAEDPAFNYSHLQRYAFACCFSKGKQVLDLACGEGYGSFLLSEPADTVVGVDVSGEAIRHAADRYRGDCLNFIEGSITDVPVSGAGLFDLIVCFEALEHVTDHDDLLREVKRLLKREGVFLISTPDKARHTDRQGYENPFHVKELYLSEFRELLLKYFKQVHFFGQSACPSSCIRPTGAKGHRPAEAAVARIREEYVFMPPVRKAADIYIAMATDAEAMPEEHADGHYLLDLTPDAVDPKVRTIRDLEGIVRAREQHASNLEGIVSNREEQLARLKAENDNHRMLLQGVIGKAAALEAAVCQFREKAMDPGADRVPGRLLVEFGETCLGLGLLDEAKRFFECALSFDHARCPALNNLGALNYSLGDPAQSHRMFARVLEVDPGNKTALAGMNALRQGSSVSLRED